MQTRDIDLAAAEAAANKIRAEKASLNEAKAKLRNCIQIISETNDNSATDITLAAIDEVMTKIETIEGKYDSVASGIVAEANKIHQEYLEYLEWLRRQEEERERANQNRKNRVS